MTAYTPPSYVTSGEASSAQFNTETVDNIKHLKEQTPRSLHWDTFSGSTDASGFLTVAHGADFIPLVIVQPTSPLTGTVFDFARVDSIDATTFRVRALQHDGAVVASTAITGTYLCLEPA